MIALLRNGNSSPNYCEMYFISVIVTLVHPKNLTNEIAIFSRNMLHDNPIGMRLGGKWFYLIWLDRQIITGEDNQVQSYLRT